MNTSVTKAAQQTAHRGQLWTSLSGGYGDAAYTAYGNPSRRSVNGSSRYYSAHWMRPAFRAIRLSRSEGQCTAESIASGRMSTSCGSVQTSRNGPK
jgi:hypothetical protein